jgi:hypothetical protein
VGAMEIGMDQVYYNPAPESSEEAKHLVIQKNGSKTMTYHIRNLNELLTFL